jgi:phytanoyl-CoA hydroxylase
MSRTVRAESMEDIPEALIQSYRSQGFARVPGVISGEEAAEFREAALRLAREKKESAPKYNRNVFTQLVNVWREDETMKRLTLHPNVGAAAEQLTGRPMRLWHDHILIKDPHNEAPTEFHQDQPYWPHENSPDPLSAWIALVDVPVERGCMTFIPGSHARTDLEAQNLEDADSLFSIAPDMMWEQRVTVPLRAGDCTFHHGRCAHMATPNLTDDPRVAHVVIFMDARTTYSGKRHVVTDPLGLKEGEPLAGDMFPAVGN